jgi:hypothetical protein
MKMLQWNFLVEIISQQGGEGLVNNETLTSHFLCKILKH